MISHFAGGGASSGARYVPIDRKTLSLELYLGCFPHRSTATSRLYRPCRSSQSVHSLRIECFRREGHGHSDSDLLGGEVRLRGAVAVEERVLQQPRSGAHDPVEFEAAARLLLQAILIRSFDVLKCLTVRETLTISLPKELRRGLEKMAKAEGVTSSEYVRRAIKADIFRRALRAARRELVPQARAQGIYTDEDVFKIVS